MSGGPATLCLSVIYESVNLHFAQFFPLDSISFWSSVASLSSVCPLQLLQINLPVVGGQPPTTGFQPTHFFLAVSISTSCKITSIIYYYSPQRLFTISVLNLSATGLPCRPPSFPQLLQLQLLDHNPNTVK